MNAAPLPRVLHRIFAGHAFPAAVLSLLVFYKLLLVTFLLWPVSSTGLGQFAEDFKTWCFGYDPATGKVNKTLVWMMLSEPVLLGGGVAWLWWRPLKDALRTPKRLVPYPLAALVLLLSASFALTTLTRAPQEGELPFPAERLRTAFDPPAFELIDHTGKRATLEAYRGKVVVLTGVYATCGLTCPMIMGQVKRAVATLSDAQKDDVAVLAVTLDPERDGPEQLARMAEAQKVSAPLFRLLTGEPARVNAVLDRLGIERRRNPQTGVIDHTNLFLVVDRGGKIAYRFSLGDRQTRWLGRALHYLLGEPNVG